jgi:hypothetical protein
MPSHTYVVQSDENSMMVGTRVSALDKFLLESEKFDSNYRNTSQ